MLGGHETLSRPSIIAEGKVVLGPEVRRFMVLAVASQELDRVRFRSVGGQPLDDDPTRLRLHVLPDQTSAVAGPPVPNDEHPSA